jgi:preprotein translocase subunit SecA
MAGRGTDIVLGGNAEFLALAKCGHDKQHPEYEHWLGSFEHQCLEEREQVVEAGGLHIMGTERHESRRIDNQLRGRSGRQGDSGSSQFFLSLEDDLMRIFESERVAQWWDRVGVEDGEAIENKLLTRVIENAQTKVEARNFDIRKHLLDYDDVMNKQRQAFYNRRREMLGTSAIHEEVLEMAEGVLVAILDVHLSEKDEPESEDLVALAASVEAHFGVPMDATQEPFSVGGRPAVDRDALGRAIFDRLSAFIEAKQKACDGLAEEHAAIGYPAFQKLERDILLQILDAQWKDHLHTMDGLREGVSLRGYASRDPKLEYQREGYALFEEMNQRIDTQAVDVIFKFVLPDPLPQAPARSQPGAGPGSEAPEASGSRAGAPAPKAGGRTAAPKGGKIGRNDPCTCGSGRKYKKCCGAL